MDSGKKILRSRIEKDYNTKRLSDDDIKQNVILEAHFKELALLMVDKLPHNRELEEALNYLQNSKFWATKSLCMKWYNIDSFGEKEDYEIHCFHVSGSIPLLPLGLISLIITHMLEIPVKKIKWVIDRKDWLYGFFKRCFGRRFI